MVGYVAQAVRNLLMQFQSWRQGLHLGSAKFCPWILMPPHRILPRSLLESQTGFSCHAQKHMARKYTEATLSLILGISDSVSNFKWFDYFPVTILLLLFDCGTWNEWFFFWQRVWRKSVSFKTMKFHSLQGVYSKSNETQASLTNGRIICVCQIHLIFLILSPLNDLVAILRPLQFLWNFWDGIEQATDQMWATQKFQQKFYQLQCHDIDYDRPDDFLKCLNISPDSWRFPSKWEKYL